MKQLRIGLDIHGVVDARPDLFAPLTKTLVEAGHEVHILTGARKTPKIEKELEEMGIVYTHFFSILDYQGELGTHIEKDENGYMWDKSKADYCIEKGIDLHIDDSIAYDLLFKTPFLQFDAKRGAKEYSRNITHVTT
jgi:hypothetical protein